MKISKTSLTVLEKCGISRELMKFLKKKGLLIPAEIKPFEKHFRSRSEEWFYSIADRFTPPLSNAEIEVYKMAPHLLALKIQRSVELLMDISIVLQDAMDKVNLLADEKERLAAVLAILRIFHSCLDYNHLKHDRHLEYHEYEESPVGYYWSEFRKLVEKAATNYSPQKPPEWINQKMLEIISASRRPTIASEYQIVTSEMYKKIKDRIKNVDSLSIEEIIKELKKAAPDLLEVLQTFAEEFYKSLEDFVKDCIISRGLDYFSRLVNAKDASNKALEEVCSRLNSIEAKRLVYIVEILDDFANAQDIEGSVFYGLHPYAKVYLTDTLIKGYDKLRELLLSNQHLINPQYRSEVFSLLRAEDVPSKFIADREFMVNAEKFFIDDVIVLYREAIKAWREI
jgi:CRISPR/Cas system CSM-associated protein Csm2 small subunit